MGDEGKSGVVQRALVALYARFGDALMGSAPGRAAYLRAYFAYKRHVEDPFARLVRRAPRLFAGGDVLDVGANVGYTAAVFAGAVDEGRRVWAFEPERRNFELLEHVVASRRLGGRVVPVRAAVGREEGSIDLLVNRRQPTDHRVLTDAMRRTVGPAAATERVPLVSLDAFAAREGIARLAFVKVDVQGYELPVCEGMSGLLEANPGAALAIEYSPAQMAELGLDPGALRAFFEGRGYRSYLLAPSGQLTPWRVGDPLRTGRSYCDLILTRTPLD